MAQTWSKGGGSRVIIPFAPQCRNNNSDVLWFVITQTKSVRYTRFKPRLKLLIFETLYNPTGRRAGPFESAQYRQYFDKLLQKISFILIHTAKSTWHFLGMKSLYSTKLFGNPTICKDIVVMTWTYHSERATRQLTHFHNCQNGIADLSVLVQSMQYIFRVLLNDQINIQQKSVCKGGGT